MEVFTSDRNLERFLQIKNTYLNQITNVFQHSAKIDGIVESDNLVKDLELFSLGALKKRSFIVSGISGAGKTTFGNIAQENGYIKIPGVTTRKPRPEENNNDYIFVDENIFMDWVEKKEIIIHRKINGVWHGILRDSVEKFSNSSELFFMDRGVACAIDLYRLSGSNAGINLIYLFAPSIEELYRRIKNREESRCEKFVGMSDEEILCRFEEEVVDISKTLLVNYLYFVNDKISRIEKLFKNLPNSN